MLEAKRIIQSIAEHECVVSLLKAQAEEIAILGNQISSRLAQGFKILWMGNGGSAADSQHLAAEIVGRFVKERKGLSSIALTTDTSILTAVGNDYGFEYIYLRQIEAICRAGDVVVGISTSGNSSNVIHAIELAKKIGAYTVCFTGENGGRLSHICDAVIKIPSPVTARIQECHILVGHILCECIDADL